MILYFEIFNCSVSFLINSYLSEFTSSAGRAEVVGMDNAEEMIGNPLQAFQLIKRLTVDWNRVRDGMRNMKWNGECSRFLMYNCGP